jgi:hypothetical protein
MAFKYSCFISYCHGQHDLIKGFIDQLKKALKAELETLLDEEVFIDEERLKPGYEYNEELARAICESVCMVVVYSPRYVRHDYCVREYEAMRRLEERRRALLGPAAHGRGFIIPIILRGDADILARARRDKHYADFSRFTLATPDISRNPEYVDEIRRIAGVIYEQYALFRNAGSDPCASCLDFRLPPASDVEAWRPAFVNR